MGISKPLFYPQNTLINIVMPESEFTEVAFSEEIEGTLDGGASLDNDTTLNEPIAVTIQRDLKAIYSKFRYVIQPAKNIRIPGRQNPQIVPLLSDWDLWGPLLLCTIMALLLSSSD